VAIDTRVGRSTVLAGVKSWHWGPTVQASTDGGRTWTESADRALAFPSDTDTALERVLRRPVHLVNDADAAGVAEMRFGAGVGQQGTVFLITLGTGTGSALFYDGMLVPNLELGHMEIRGRDAERRSAAAARLKRGISWKAWAMDLDEHLLAIEKLFSPKLFIIGGGVSKRSERFIPRLTVRAAVVPAKLLNDAGIVGAAMAAAETERRKGD